MFSFITLGTNDLKKSKAFYDALLKSINIINVENEDGWFSAYAKKTSLNKIEFYLMRPHNKKEATFGNGTMILRPIMQMTACRNPVHSICTFSLMM